uniref:Uncharacterized protein n=1 Tax=Arundo donax TaxID=35708 RepID=A0A0A8Y3M0_ARUDO
MILIKHCCHSICCWSISF